MRGPIHQCERTISVDGVLTPGEKQFLVEAARLLGIPAKVAQETMYEVVAGYLQAQAAKKAPFAKLQAMRPNTE